MGVRVSVVLGDLPSDPWRPRENFILGVQFDLGHDESSIFIVELIHLPLV
jgi:hypothetical protein